MSKQIPGYEGYYEIDPEGEIRSIDRIIIDTLGRKQHVRAKVLKHHFDDRGRAKINLYKDGKGRTFKVKALINLCYGGKL